MTREMRRARRSRRLKRPPPGGVRDRLMYRSSGWLSNRSWTKKLLKRCRSRRNPLCANGLWRRMAFLARPSVQQYGLKSWTAVSQSELGQQVMFFGLSKSMAFWGTVVRGHAVKGLGISITIGLLPFPSPLEQEEERKMWEENADIFLPPSFFCRNLSAR
jgi:hypothetical protein